MAMERNLPVRPEAVLAVGADLLGGLLASQCVLAA